MHSTSNLEDGYMGGGKRIKNSIRKHGKEAHKKEIIEFLENREDLINKEIELVNEVMMKDPMCMNLVLGGKGGIPYFWNDQQRNNFFKRGAIATNAKIKKSPDSWKKSCIENPKKISKGLKERYSSGEIVPGFKNKKHSDRTISLMIEKKRGYGIGSTNSQFGKKWIYNDALKKSMIIDTGKIEDFLLNGWRIGRKMRF